MNPDPSLACQLEFRPYHRPFRQPLQTAHGPWTVRQGILLRLRDGQGRVGWGEITPLPWFGSESLESALACCTERAVGQWPDLLDTIPDSHPACQFGFEMAWNSLVHSGQARPAARLPQCALLPAGIAALSAWKSLWQTGAQTFKWKIGVAPMEQEQEIFGQLTRLLPAEALLRLDANGGLTPAATIAWLRVCDRTSQVEYLEQPLPPEQFVLLMQLAQQFRTPLALDESVATLAQVQTCYQRGWQGVFVIKPAIAGFPSRLRQFCQQHRIDAVFSSVFETAIGRQAGLQLAAELGNGNRATGYGTGHWFAEADRLNSTDVEVLWHHLSTTCSDRLIIPG